MEFRVFVPLVSGEDASWLGAAVISEYMEAIAVLMTLVGDVLQTEENRTDIYLIGGSHFGIKFRSTSKLEIKVRTSVASGFIEEWKKSKLRDSGVQDNKLKILEILSGAGHSSSKDRDAQLIDEEKLVKVVKRRRAEFVGRVAEEFCFLDVEQVSVRRSWISVAIEGALEDIESCIANQTQLQLLWRVCEIASRIVNNNIAEAKRMSFVPVMGGYPTWTRVVGSSIVEGETEELMQRMREFLDARAALTGALVFLEHRDSVILLYDTAFRTKLVVAGEADKIVPAWTLPGGTLDPGSDVYQTAAKELYEESKGLLLVGPNYFREAAAVGAFKDIQTASGLRRCFYLKLTGEFSTGRFDMGTKRSRCFNETIAIRRVRKSDFDDPSCPFVSCVDGQGKPKTDEPTRLLKGKEAEHGITGRTLQAANPTGGRPEPYEILITDRPTAQAAISQFLSLGIPREHVTDVNTHYVADRASGR